MRAWAVWCKCYKDKELSQDHFAKEVHSNGFHYGIVLFDTKGDAREYCRNALTSEIKSATPVRIELPEPEDD